MKKWILLFCLLAFASCNKDKTTPYVLSLEYCRDNVKFTCVEPKSDLFFSGTINDIPFCISDGVDGCFSLNGVRSEFVTSAQNPTLSVGSNPVGYSYGFVFSPPIFDNYNGIIREFSPRISLFTPSTSDSTFSDVQKVIENYIHKGDLILRDKSIDKFSGFEFSVDWVCALLPGYEYYQQNTPYSIPMVDFYLTNTIGDQTNSKLAITEFNKTVVMGQIIYDIVFHIECNLYYQDVRNHNKPVAYGRLQDGVLKTRVVIDI